MADTEAIQQADAQATETAHTMVLPISAEGRRHSIHPEQIFSSTATRHCTGPSLRQPVLNWTAKDK